MICAIQFSIGSITEMSRSFEHFLKDFQSAALWVKSLDIQLNQGRFQEYIEEVERGVSKKGGAEQSDSFHLAITAIESGMELILIHQNLRHLPTDQLKHRLRRYIVGTTLEKDERSNAASNEPRNLGFELVLAAKLASAGIQVELPDDGDLLIRTTPNVLAECKRPQSIRGLKSSVCKASYQIESRVAKGSNPEAIGLIALSIGKSVLRGEQYLDVPTDSQAKSALERTVVAFHQRHCHVWQKRELAHVYAVLIHFAAIVHLAEPNKWVWGQFTILDQIKEESSGAAISYIYTSLEDSSGLWTF